MNSDSQLRIDRGFMSLALELARSASQQGEVPVGAVVVMDGEVIGTGMNRCETDHDPSAHAEVLALRSAARSRASSRLDGATLYVTLEPCLMCAGALLQARVARLVFGAREPRTGAVLSIHEALRLPGIDHHVALSEGVLADEAAQLLKDFFQDRRP